MPFIPNSKVRLYNSVPLDISNDNQLWFDSKYEQNNYFANLGGVVADITDSEYVDDNLVFYINKNKEQLRNVNYMSYQNANYGNKWIYAFVTKIEWVNPNVSMIHFTLDDFQTYLFDLEFKPCYVEREHTNNDTIGANIIDENIGYGDYVIKQETHAVSMKEYNIIVASTKMITEPSADDFGGHNYNGVFSGIRYYGFDNIDDLTNVLQNFRDYSDSIYAIFMCPKFCSQFSETGDHRLIESEQASTVNFSDETISIPKNIDGYVPKNNKLFVYPYNVMTLSNNSGAENLLRYEFFKNINNIKLQIKGVVTQGVQCVCYPADYKNSQRNLEYQLVSSANPTCLYVNDVYSTWLTQNAIPNGIQAVSGSVMAGVGIAMANPMVTLGGIGYITSILGNMGRMSAIPDEVKGSQGGNYVMAGEKENTFVLYQKTITYQYAKMIDDYFTRYGYATNQLKVPNFHSRKYWNFVKTGEFNVTGECPSDSINNIKNMFNKGITLWHTNDVGNFNLNNTII